MYRSSSKFVSSDRDRGCHSAQQRRDTSEALLATQYHEPRSPASLAHDENLCSQPPSTGTNGPGPPSSSHPSPAQEELDSRATRGGQLSKPPRENVGSSSKTHHDHASPMYSLPYSYVRVAQHHADVTSEEYQIPFQPLSSSEPAQPAAVTQGVLARQEDDRIDHGGEFALSASAHVSSRSPPPTPDLRRRLHFDSEDVEVSRNPGRLAPSESTNSSAQLACARVTQVRDSEHPEATDSQPSPPLAAHGAASDTEVVSASNTKSGSDSRMRAVDSSSHEEPETLDLASGSPHRSLTDEAIRDQIFNTPLPRSSLAKRGGGALTSEKRVRFTLQSSRRDQELAEADRVGVLQARNQNIKSGGHAQAGLASKAALLPSHSHSQATDGTAADHNPEKLAHQVSIARSNSILKRAVAVHHRSQAVPHNDENSNPNARGHSRRRSKGKQDRGHAHTMGHLPSASRQRAGAVAQTRAAASSKVQPISENRTYGGDGGPSSRAANGSPSLSIIEKMLANRTVEREVPSAVSAQSLPAKTPFLSQTSPAFSQPNLFPTTQYHPKQKLSTAHRAKSLFQKSFFPHPRGPQPQPSHKHSRASPAESSGHARHTHGGGAPVGGTHAHVGVAASHAHGRGAAVPHAHAGGAEAFHARPIPEHSPLNEQPRNDDAHSNRSNSSPPRESDARISAKRDGSGSVANRNRHDGGNAAGRNHQDAGSTAGHTRSDTRIRSDTGSTAGRNGIGSMSGRSGHGHTHWERGVLVKVLRDQVKSLTEMLSTKDTEFAEKLLTTTQRHQNEVRRLRQKTVEVREEYAHRNELFRTLEKGYNENSKQASAQIQEIMCENKRLKFENQSLLVELRLLKDQPESNVAALDYGERARLQSEIENLKATIWEERNRKSKDSSMSSNNSQPSPSTRPAEKARTEDMMKVYQRALGDLKVTKERSRELEEQLKQIKSRCEERESNLRKELEDTHRERVQDLRDENTTMKRTLEALTMENRRLASRIDQGDSSKGASSNNDDVEALRREIDHWRREAARLQEEATTSGEEVIHLQNTLELARDRSGDANLLSVPAAMHRRSNAPSLSDSFLVPLPDDCNVDSRRTKSVESINQGTQTERTDHDEKHASSNTRAAPSPGVAVVPHRHTELRGVITTVSDLMKLVEDAMAAGGDLSASRFSISAGSSDFRMSRLSTGSLLQAQSPRSDNDSSFGSDITFDQEHFDKDMDTLREGMAALHTKISDFYASKYGADMQQDGCVVM